MIITVCIKDFHFALAKHKFGEIQEAYMYFRRNASLIFQNLTFKDITHDTSTNFFTVLTLHNSCKVVITFAI